MKKILLGCALTAAMTASLYAKPAQDAGKETSKEASKEGAPSAPKAGQNKFFIGASVAGSMLDTSSDYYNAQGMELDYIEGEKSLTGIGGSARVGYDIYFRPEQALRIYADYLGSSFGKSEILGKANMQHIGLNLDYRYDFASGFSLFGGGGVVSSSVKSDLGSLSQIGGALNLGAAYALTSYLELELRAKLLFADYYSNKMITPIKGTSEAAAARQSFDMDAPMNLMLGVNFRF